MEDIILRPWRRDDARQLAAIGNNRNVWLNLRDRFPHPYTVMDAGHWLESHAGEKPLQHFCIEYEGRVAGSCGLVLKDDVYRKTIEIGYFVGELYWGRGIASRAVGLLVDYVQQHFDVVRIYAEVFERNKASMSVLRKNGFYLEGIRKKAVIKEGIVMDDYIWVKLP